MILNFSRIWLTKLLLGDKLSLSKQFKRPKKDSSMNPPKYQNFKTCLFRQVDKNKIEFTMEVGNLLTIKENFEYFSNMELILSLKKVESKIDNQTHYVNIDFNNSKQILENLSALTSSYSNDKDSLYKNNLKISFYDKKNTALEKVGIFSFEKDSSNANSINFSVINPAKRTNISFVFDSKSFFSMINLLVEFNKNYLSLSIQNNQFSNMVYSNNKLESRIENLEKQLNTISDSTTNLYRYFLSTEKIPSDKVEYLEEKVEIKQDNMVVNKLKEEMKQSTLEIINNDQITNVFYKNFIPTVEQLFNRKTILVHANEKSDSNTFDVIGSILEYGLIDKKTVDKIKEDPFFYKISYQLIYLLKSIDYEIVFNNNIKNALDILNKNTFVFKTNDFKLKLKDNIKFKQLYMSLFSLFLVFSSYSKTAIKKINILLEEHKETEFTNEEIDNILVLFNILSLTMIVKTIFMSFSSLNKDWLIDINNEEDKIEFIKNIEMLEKKNLFEYLSNNLKLNDNTQIKNTIINSYSPALLNINSKFDEVISRELDNTINGIEIELNDPDSIKYSLMKFYKNISKNNEVIKFSNSINYLITYLNEKSDKEYLDDLKKINNKEEFKKFIMKKDKYTDNIELGYKLLSLSTEQNSYEEFKKNIEIMIKTYKFDEEQYNLFIEKIVDENRI